MPTYEYQCNDCGREFEVRQRISEPALTQCETCGGTLKRLLSAAPFILKGKGWYVTDYPSESRKKALESEKSSEKSSDKSSESTGKKDGAADKAPAEKSPAPTSAASTSAPASASAGAKTPSKPSSTD